MRRWQPVSVSNEGPLLFAPVNICGQETRKNEGTRLVLQPDVFITPYPLIPQSRLLQKAQFPEWHPSSKSEKPLG